MQNFNILLLNIMCRKVKCHTCGKFIAIGCGKHVEDVLKGIPKEERCDDKCDEFIGCNIL